MVSVGWSTAADWDRWEEVPVNGIDNTLTRSVADGVGVLSGSGSPAAGNDRRVLQLLGFSAQDVDLRVDFRITGGAPSQCGLVFRRFNTAPTTWQNIIFAATGNVLIGEWEFNGTTLLATNQQPQTSSLWGSPIVSASGNGTTVTVTCEYGHLLTAGEIIGLDGVGAFGQVTVAATPSDTTFTFTNATVGSWTGGRYRWVIAPNRMRTLATRNIGPAIITKQWVPPHPEPDWGDTTRVAIGFTPARLASAGVAPTVGVGKVGLICAHLGSTGTIYVDNFAATSLNPPEPAAPEQGSWGSLLSIVHEASDRYRAESEAPPVACPNDGEPLESGPGGVLHCRYDGFTHRS